MKLKFITFALASLQLAAQPGSASISGSVVAAPGNQALGGTLVTLTRTDLTMFDSAKRRYSTVSRTDGSFSFTGMPDGRYAICGARMPHEDYVDYCAWTMQPPQVTLRAGAPITGYRVALERGVRLEVTVGDPDGALRRIGDERKRGQMRLHVLSREVPPNAMHFFKSDLGGSEYYITIPRRQGMRLIAAADEADLTRRNEPPGLARNRIEEPINLPANQNSQRVEFQFRAKRRP